MWETEKKARETEKGLGLALNAPYSRVRQAHKCHIHDNSTSDVPYSRYMQHLKPLGILQQWKFKGIVRAFSYWLDSSVHWFHLVGKTCQWAVLACQTVPVRGNKAFQEWGGWWVLTNGKWSDNIKILWFNFIYKSGKKGYAAYKYKQI